MRRLDVGECNEESDPSDIVLLDIALADETVINLAERLTVRWRRAAASPNPDYAFFARWMLRFRSTISVDVGSRPDRLRRTGRAAVPERGGVHDHKRMLRLRKSHFA